MANEKGATYFDKLCHKFYDEAKPKGYDSKCFCRYCGSKIEVCYCEERLFFVRCTGCENLALIKAGNPIQAAVRTLGRVDL